jgi:hypothetical protein
MVIPSAVTCRSQESSKFYARKSSIEFLLDNSKTYDARCGRGDSRAQPSADKLTLLSVLFFPCCPVLGRQSRALMKLKHRGGVFTASAYIGKSEAFFALATR